MSRPATVEDPGASRSAFRADIQGLRAVAVSLVLVYHLLPGALTGGYVGVDVFFVISGFLITSHLLQHPPTTRRDLAEFWGRRIRRLLPAAFLVLAATVVAAHIVAPSSQWSSIASEVIASAAYVQNWVLAGTSVDYLAAANAPTPTQHFWSLSVEEQFYLVWPFLILGSFRLASSVRSRWPRTGWPRLARWTMLAAVAASLAVSVWLTSNEPSSAYFVTPTRVWELAIGGVLATFAPLGAGRHPVVPSVVAWVGLAMMLLAGFAFSGATAFPGWAALLPVLGSALVIYAAVPASHWPSRLLALRPVQYLGDISYSVYLWHWPLIALAPYAFGKTGPFQMLGIVAATVVLSGLTKRFVEDPFRFARSSRPLVATYRFALVGMVALVAVAGLQLVEVEARTQSASAALAAAEASNGGCLGAAAIARGFDVCPQDPAGAMVPDPTLARDDKSDAYADDCWTESPYTERRICHYGDGPVRVALVGNSHAGMWLPALQVLARQRGWTITTFLVSQCNVMDAPLQFDTQAKTDNCLAYTRWVMEQTTRSPFDLLITAERQSVPLLGKSFDASAAPAAAAYAHALTAWDRAGTNVLVLRDSPDPGRELTSVPDCLAQHPTDHGACSGTPASWASIDPLYEAALALGSLRVRTFDPTPYFCTASSCPAVIGGVVVYFDASHMTATYAATLAPYLDGPIAEALEL